MTVRTVPGGRCTHATVVITVPVHSPEVKEAWDSSDVHISYCSSHLVTQTGSVQVQLPFARYTSGLCSSRCMHQAVVLYGGCFRMGTPVLHCDLHRQLAGPQC